MISFRVDAAEPRSHHYAVTVTVPRPAAGQVVSLPVWIPGSYLVREFARHLSRLTAEQGGVAVEVQQLDKASWRIGCGARGTLTLRYRVYAWDTSVRAAYLDERRGFFNGTSLFLRVQGREAEPQRVVTGRLPRGWQVATAMPVQRVAADGRGSYLAADYDELVDHPFELGTFWRGRFTAAGVPHEFVVAGALPAFDGDRLLADARRICETVIAFWHGAGPRAARPPMARYVFMLNAVDDGYGGLEHRASTALIAARRDLPRPGQGAPSDGYVTLLGLVSHEYFHTWNVKRLKPAEFARYDYTQENYTGLLWFFEGFTSYYDDLLLRRAGLVDEARYLKLFAKNLNATLATPGRKVQSVAEASFDAWVKYYRGDENTPNATVSYYAKGACIAAALDLALRAAGGSLDDVMRRLWVSSEGGPIDEAAILRAVREAVPEGGEAIARHLRGWVHGTDDPPLERLLGEAGVVWRGETPSTAQRLGLRVAESALTGVQVKQVLTGGAGEQAGLAAGDELIAANGWRLRRLDDLPLFAGAAGEVELLVARDQRVFGVRLAAGTAKGAGSITLALEDKPLRARLGLRHAWLATG